MLDWCTEHVSHIDYVVFFFGGKKYMLHVTNVKTKGRSMVDKEAWA
jgi:hypothetical protein